MEKTADNSAVFLYEYYFKKNELANTIIPNTIRYQPNAWKSFRFK